MRTAHLFAAFLALTLLSACATMSNFDTAYSIVDTGDPIDMESDF